MTPFLLPYEQGIFRQKIRARDKITNRPRCPIIAPMLGRLWVILGTEDIYECDTPIHTAFTWMELMMRAPFFGLMEDKLNIKDFIEGFLIGVSAPLQPVVGKPPLQAPLTGSRTTLGGVGGGKTRTPLAPR